MHAHTYTHLLSRLLFSSLRVGWPYCYKSLCNNHDQLVFCEPPTVQGIGRDNETKHFPKIAIDLDNKRTKFTVQLKINQRFAVVLFFFCHSQLKVVHVYVRLCVCALKIFQLKIEKKNSSNSKVFQFSND